VEPLIAELEAKDKEVRRAAAEALVGMYKLGNLSDAHDRSILAERNRIIQSIGVDFPL
jgi:hypothetical protein